MLTTSLGGLIFDSVRKVEGRTVSHDNFVFYNLPAMQPDEPEDEYENWKLNSGYLYDRLFVNRL